MRSTIAPTNKRWDGAQWTKGFYQQNTTVNRQCASPLCKLQNMQCAQVVQRVQWHWHWQWRVYAGPGLLGIRYRHNVQRTSKSNTKVQAPPRATQAYDGKKTKPVGSGWPAPKPPRHLGMYIGRQSAVSAAGSRPRNKSGGYASSPSLIIA